MITPKILVLAAAATAAVALTACSSSGTPSAASSGGNSQAAASVSVKTAKIGSATVLTNANGFTLYSFSPDTSASSKCNGKCATVWPPVEGPVTAAGITGTFGTITRADGSTQATFDGHPLYAYVGDTSPGQAKGNGLNAAGGLWTEITPSVSTAAAGPSTGSGGGY
jgi:predicted lipoprotein with Yx(FWY)xxD motif